MRTIYLQRNEEIRKGRLTFILLDIVYLDRRRRFTIQRARAAHLDVPPDFPTDEFMHTFKTFITGRGKPDKLYSDNAKTFIAASKRVRKIMKDD